ncbi:unnamed protein product [Phytophthora fragariaefolia]|uniref:Unnamed protein product n=1 Tax=Phytophthora fragariaefolia TaxID=1490495 RepID=A0A9W6TTT7_9STRA|nr:unnamed protein product [Phytophthora fragariaefolia]
MDCAAMFGNLELVKWLHSNQQEGCSTEAMGHGVAQGRKWLHANRSEGFSEIAMESAVRNNRLDMVKWMYEHSENCLKGNIDIAAAPGNLEIVSWLHFRGGGNCSQHEMDDAAANGHLEIVKFLHEHGREGVLKECHD